jgi:hypothetical protein
LIQTAIADALQEALDGASSGAIAEAIEESVQTAIDGLTIYEPDMDQIILNSEGKLTLAHPVEISATEAAAQTISQANPDALSYYPES